MNHLPPHLRLVAPLLVALGCSGSDPATRGTPQDSDAPTCDAPGTPTTPTPSASSDAAGMNVEALACTRTALALACELGATHAYGESSDGTTRTITANGIVDHDVGDFPNPGNPHAITAQRYTYRVPVVPSGLGTSREGVFGILFTGAVLDPGTAETWNDDPSWRYEALRYATAPSHFDGDATNHPTSLGVDCNLAHVQPSGAYHYHGLPTSLVQAGAAVRQVGWAADGYPIVASYGHVDGRDVTSTIRPMRASWRLKEGDRPSGAPQGPYDGTFGADWEYVEGLGDLDACNGRMDTLVVDGNAVYTYVYVLTDTFPFIPRCWRAEPDGSFDRANAGGGGGGNEGPPACTDTLTTNCCGDDVCDGPETASTCGSDCG